MTLDSHLEDFRSDALARLGDLIADAHELELAIQRDDERSSELAKNLVTALDDLELDLRVEIREVERG
jgi:hypothetical protein